ncbi:signal peptidase I LepB5 (plasmid) [Butyrivibrio proteoclasticus B316]|uniref:Signal peptidase I n=1 Tax=Butyrivibrio proteoclasticus (strain ATCC 51982 / DSM 14932 / B316) TaxID=515622 RepID=E0S574_BUTPB|nr:signal peptidase I [Butyrivibrio proteoclasticus]ADL36556.1 signal peptidase I LepB5 [Butyrivibrio proteoclasticus B316]
MKRLVYYLAVPIMVLMLLCPRFAVTSHAEESKTIQVPINKNYTSAKFTLNFEYYDDYVVVIKSPSGKEYKGVLASTNVVQCVVDDIEIGQWQVLISYPEEIKDEPSEEASTESSEENEGESVQRRAISPVKVQVQGSTENLVDVDRGISVATDIAGLKMYFKDDSFVAEWTDTTCGTVNVEVVNAKNLQKIDTQQVQGNSYCCPLEPNVQEIMVKIVPAVSSSVQGAENTFTFKFDNHPDATVTYEDLTITNHDSMLVSCELRDKYSVRILVNGKQVENTDVLDTGIYEFQVPIEVGTNELVTYIVDSDGNMRSTKYSVDKDVIGPSLELVSSYEDIVTQNESIVIEGAVDDFKTLMINSAEVEIEGDNTFKYEYKLKEGVNQIAIIASDEAGNETEYDIAVERVIPEEKPIPWLKIIICATLGGILGIYVVEVIRRKNNPEKYEKKKKDDEDHSEYDDVDISHLSKKEKKDLMKGPHIAWDILSFAVPLIAAYIVLSYIVMVSVIQSGSMAPTLSVGNTVFYNRLAYVNSEPQRGDVIVFYSDEYGSYFGKRIIGMPGDKIRFKDGYVVVNNQFCDETAYISSEIETNCSKEFEVPEGCYFLLGDNRENSNDSRYWKEPYVARNKIVGKYMGQIDFSFERDILKVYAKE